MTRDENGFSEDGEHSGKEGATTLLARSERPLDGTSRKGEQHTAKPSNRRVPSLFHQKIGFSGSLYRASAERVLLNGKARDS